MGVVLDEAEAAGGLVESIEAHDEPLDFAALGKELVDLLFCGVKGAIEVVLGHVLRNTMGGRLERTGCRRRESSRWRGGQRRVLQVVPLHCRLGRVCVYSRDW